MTDNVVYMSEFLARRRIALVGQANELIEKAKKISKKEDLNADPFAAPLMKKVEAIAERCEQIEKHLRFIVRGGLGSPVPARGYQTAYTQSPPPVKLTVTMPNPIV